MKLGKWEYRFKSAETGTPLLLCNKIGAKVPDWVGLDWWIERVCVLCLKEIVP